LKSAAGNAAGPEVAPVDRLCSSWTWLAWELSESSIQKSSESALIASGRVQVAETVPPLYPTRPAGTGEVDVTARKVEADSSVLRAGRMGSVSA